MPKPITRNLTPFYVRVRHERRQSRGRLLGEPAPQPGQKLLPCDADTRTPCPEVALEMTSLPPQWVEAAEDAREDLKTLKDKLAALTKAHHKRLLKVFGDDGSPDKDVEAMTRQCSALVRQCEQRIHQVKSRGAASSSDRDLEFRQNVQRGLATQLQHLSQQFRQQQKDYLSEIRGRQKGSLWDDSPATGGGEAGKALDLGFNDMQLQEIESMEVNASQRNEEICQIAASISDLHTVFKELAVLVIDQGSVLDRIDYNIEQVVHDAKKANTELQKAEEHSKSNRAMKCIYVLVVINLVLIVILIVKARS